jgi:transposase
VVAAIVEPLLEARAVLRVQFAKLHRMLLDLVRADPICRRLMSAPGVGPIVALTFRTCVDNPARFSRSKCVGAHYGLAPRLWQGRSNGQGISMRRRNAAFKPL